MLWFHQILQEPRVLITIRIFWVVSVPLAMILMVLFFTSWSGKIRDRLKNLVQRREETRFPEYMPRPTSVGASGGILKRLRGRKSPNSREKAEPIIAGVV